MKISDLIGDLVDIFGQHKTQEEPLVKIGTTKVEIENRPDVHMVSAEIDDLSDTSTMVAPLQQKLELLKKAVGVDNMYSDQESDDLDQILKIAGVPTATIFDAGDDEPLDS
jgi:hypothetical protein